jgi:hypothetical protein
MDYVGDAIMLVVALFCIVTIALLIWVAHLLVKVAELERLLRKTRAWSELDSQKPKRRERL